MRGSAPAQNLGAPLGETRLHEATGQTTLIQVGAGGGRWADPTIID
jgi:hypothetical protein